MKSILIVDDMPANIKVLGEILKDAYQLYIATSGEKALDVALRETPDLILLDINMPGMNGHEVCQRLKQDPRTRGIPVMFLTASNEEHDEALGFELGAVDYIIKPFNPVIVLARVRTHLSHKTSQNDLENLINERTDALRQEIEERKLAQAILNKSRESYRSFARIGIALSVEKNIHKLLNMIVDQARHLSRADAGTLYILNANKTHLTFEILQNDSMQIRMGGTSGVEIRLPEVPLYIDGRPNHANVSSYVALTGKTVNIEDVYEAEGFDFTGPRKYDATTGYRSKSMLVIALQNHENEIIGVLQLLNAQDPDTGEVIAFSEENVDLVASLASQAAVALTNAQLIQDLRNLFYAFIKSIATAIDEKSPYTGGHINRVVDISIMLARKINETREGPFENITFSEEEIEELRLAAWMHDVGKIVTPEYVVDKSTKLQVISDLIHLIEMRFELIAQVCENRILRGRIELLEKGESPEAARDDGQDRLRAELDALTDDLEFIRMCNQPGEYLSDERLQRIQTIAAKTYELNGKTCPYLSASEVKNLSIRKGSLNDDERRVIEHHATMTMKILTQLPFPRKLCNVPKYASEHHEKLDGSGYPLGLPEKYLPLQSRIMALADIFEALTAPDRPYKKPMTISQAIGIMELMKKNRHIDPDLYDLFTQSNLHIEYARKVMKPSQIDMDTAGKNET